MTVFQRVGDSRRMEMFEDRPGPARVLIDTDTANEVDDQYALAWALLSPDRIEIEAIVAEPYGHIHMREQLTAEYQAIRAGTTVDGIEEKYGGWACHLIDQDLDPADIHLVGPAEGMEESYEEIHRVLGKLGISGEGLVFRGSDRYMPAPDVPVESEGAHRIIEAALADDERVLHVVAIGCVTNITSALLMAPEISSRMVVNWTSGYPTWVNLDNTPSLNLVQDPHASRLLFQSGVPLVYLPGYHIGAQLNFSRPEAEAWIKGKGAIGDYLYHIYLNNPIWKQRGVEQFPGLSWVVWDLINIGWLINRRWVPTRVTTTPYLDDNLVWQGRPGGPVMLEAVGIDRNAIFHDLITKLDNQDQILASRAS
ncbi:MAG: nucleoside hydrolase [bacterium]|nr:nucleoside hydrolase [bacterium]